MMIRIIYTDGRFDYIRNSFLDQLLSLKKIEKFYRHSEGWITLCIDPIRGVGGNYDGFDRRMNDSKDLLKGAVSFWELNRIV